MNIDSGALAILAVVLVCAVCIVIRIWADRGKHIIAVVTSRRSGINYHAFKYRIGADSIPWIKIYNHISGDNEWYPIYHFKDPFVIMYSIDPQWTLSHLNELIVLPIQFKKLTEDTKL